jgi:sec-independent protein translocase protein TatB
MFDVAPQELLVIAAIAVAVIPSKDLPKAMRFAGQWIGRARGMARHFRTGIDEMIRQAELEEIEKKWREENERIMREHPLHDAIEHPPEPPAPPALPMPAAEETSVSAAPLEGQTAEAGAELRPSVPADNPPPAAAQDEHGPELPLGLPPRS